MGQIISGPIIMGSLSDAMIVSIVQQTRKTKGTNI